MRKRFFCLLVCLLLPLTALTEALPDTMDVEAASAQASSVLNTPGREHCGKENCFWETEMDYTDTEAV